MMRFYRSGKDAKLSDDLDMTINAHFYNLQNNDGTATMMATELRIGYNEEFMTNIIEAFES